MNSSNVNAGDATSDDASIGITTPGVTTTGDTGISDTTTGATIENARQQTGEVVEQVQEQAGQALGQVQEKASEVTARAGEQAVSRLAQGKDQASEQIDNVAQALREAGENLQRQNSETIGDYAVRASDGLSQFADSLRQSDVNDLLRQGEDFARREPVLFLGGAFTVGVLLARFLKSSSQPSYTRKSTQAPSTDYGTSNYGTPVYDSVDETTRALPAPDDTFNAGVGTMASSAVAGDLGTPFSDTLDDTLNDAMDDSLAGDSVNAPLGTAFAPGTPTAATADAGTDFDFGTTGTATSDLAGISDIGDDDLGTTSTAFDVGTTTDTSTDDQPRTTKTDSVEEY